MVLLRATLDHLPPTVMGRSEVFAKHLTASQPSFRVAAGHTGAVLAQRYPSRLWRRWVSFPKHENLAERPHGHLPTPDRRPTRAPAGFRISTAEVCSPNGNLLTATTLANKIWLVIADVIETQDAELAVRLSRFILKTSRRA
ncbi:MAG: hypothetical protein DMG96_08375 [Acidobacteria bacterium]|nr:MAG: hypothetical protein DMG96_08375 [Acidobacteriota bacterium]